MSVPLSIPSGRLHTDLPVSLLADFALGSGQCSRTRDGALVLLTGRFTGRAPQDRYIVEDEQTRPRVEWGARNQGISEVHYQALKEYVCAHLARAEVFEVNAHAGGEEGLPLTVFTTSAAHALFARPLTVGSFGAPSFGAGMLPVG